MATIFRQIALILGIGVLGAAVMFAHIVSVTSKRGGDIGERFIGGLLSAVIAGFGILLISPSIGVASNLL